MASRGVHCCGVLLGLCSLRFYKCRMSNAWLQSFAIAGMLLASMISGSAAEPLPAQDPLPGVQSEYSTVSPAPPEPEEPSSPAERNRFKAGDWDVTISGSVSVGIGVGKRLGDGQD